MEIRFDKDAVKFLKLVLAWDPDFTKLTYEERERLEAAEKRMDSGEYIKADDIEWD